MLLLLVEEASPPPLDDLLLLPSGSRASSAAPEFFSEGESIEPETSPDLPEASPLADFFLRKDTLRRMIVVIIRDICEGTEEEE